MKPNTKVKTWVGTITGIRSHGKWGRELSRKLFESKKAEIEKGTFHITNITYGFLWAVACITPWIKRVMIEYLSSRLTTVCYKYPEAKHILILHSYASWAVPMGLLRFPQIEVDTIIFIGAVTPCDYPWNNLIETGRVKEVYNFVSQRDYVQWVSRWPFGGAGRYGFEQLANGKVRNIYRKRWGHNGFIEAIRNGEIEKIIDGRGDEIKSD